MISSNAGFTRRPRLLATLQSVGNGYVVAAVVTKVRGLGLQKILLSTVARRLAVIVTPVRPLQQKKAKWLRSRGQEILV